MVIDSGMPDGDGADGDLLDRDKLAELYEALGAESLAMMLDMVDSSVQAEMAAIRVALAHGDRQAAHRACHTLKGFAGNLGLQRLSRVAAELDQHLRYGAADPQRDAALYRRLDQAAAETVRAITDGTALSAACR